MLVASAIALAFGYLISDWLVEREAIEEDARESLMCSRLLDRLEVPCLRFAARPRASDTPSTSRPVGNRDGRALS